MNAIVSFDKQVFFYINHLPHNVVYDGIALLLSGVGTAGLVWFVLAALLFIREEKKDHRFFIPVGLTGISCWIFVELMLKPWVGRLRPAESMGAIIVGSLNDSFSFPSGHAAMSWAMAVVLANKEPKWRWAFYVLAIAISFSRMYLGKHYPLDVLVGGLLGWFIATETLYFLLK